MIDQRAQTKSEVNPREMETEPFRSQDTFETINYEKVSYRLETVPHNFLFLRNCRFGMNIIYQLFSAEFQVSDAWKVRQFAKI